MVINMKYYTLQKIKIKIKVYCINPETITLTVFWYTLLIMAKQNSD